MISGSLVLAIIISAILSWLVAFDVINLRHPVARQVVVFLDAVTRDPKAHMQNVKELFDLYDAGKIKPYVSERFTLAEASKAISHLASRKAMGKVVVTMD